MRSVTFSPDGQFLASGGWDGVALWRVGLGGPVNRPPSTPILLSPSDNAVVSPTPTFKMKSTDPDGDQVRFGIEARQGSVTKVFETPFFASGAEATYTVPSNQAFTDGQWTWKAKAIDQRGAESNWSETRSFTVRKDAPDLVPKDLVVNPTKVMPGGKVTASVKVFNQGRVKASASKTRVRLSRSADAPSTFGPLLAEFNTPELNVNQYVTHTKEVTIPSDTQPGDYFVWVIVDADSTVGQSDETNDRIKVALKVEAAAPAGAIDVTVFDVSVNLDTGVINTSNPLSGITVILLKDGQQVAFKKTGSDGKARFEGQSAGDYTVWATFTDSQTGLPLRAEESVTLSGGGSVATTLNLGVSIIRQLWDIKGRLERLKVSLWDFSWELPGLGYDTWKINEAVATLARDAADTQRALEALQRLLLALEMSQRFLNDTEALTSQIAGVALEVASVASAISSLIDTIKASRRFPKWVIEGLINRIIGEVLFATFETLSLLFKAAKRPELATFADEVGRFILEKTQKEEAFQWVVYGFERLAKRIVEIAGSQVLRQIYIAATQNFLDEAAGRARWKRVSGS